VGFNPDECLAPSSHKRQCRLGIVSFHTVLAEELIEERPDDSREAGTRQMKYLGK